MTNRRALESHVDILDFCNRNYHMRHAAVDKVNGLVFIADGKLHVQSQISRLGHSKGHQIAFQFRGNHAGLRFKRNFAFCPPTLFAKRAKQRAPLPHISASPPSALK